MKYLFYLVSMKNRVAQNQRDEEVLVLPGIYIFNQFACEGWIYMYFVFQKYIINQFTTIIVMI